MWTAGAVTVQLATLAASLEWVTLLESGACWPQNASCEEEVWGM